MKEYDKESWWEYCKQEKPDLTREEFEFRWMHFCRVVEMIAQMRGFNHAHV